jgi:isopentenyl diphosphate isomerase/L-lactate dehydrogenase-like FMN-dependent dehydrogenase
MTTSGPSTMARWMGRRDARVARRITSVPHAQRLAHRRVPAPVENYVEGGAGSELTLEANLAAVRSVPLLPRLGITSGQPPNLETTVLGSKVSMPVLLSPIGFTRMMHTAGDVAGVTAAGAAKTIFTLSSMSGHSMEEVKAAATEPVWFQLYFLGGRMGAEQLVERARKSDFAAIVVTMDTQIPGDRLRESKYGLSPPLQFDRRTATKMARFVATRPQWLIDQALDGFQLDLVHSHASKHNGSLMTADEGLLEWIAQPPRWSDLEWIRESFGGPIVVKGVLSPEDARRAVDSGASALIVSNHGGRQLDGAPASFSALPKIIRAVGHEVEVMVDGGMRSGADVVRALAIGARAAMVGRSWAYGLCAAGQPGVARVLDLLRTDIDRTLRLMGADSISDLAELVAAEGERSV